MKTLRYAIDIYRLYRVHHPAAYALRMAWDIGLRKLPF